MSNAQNHLLNDLLERRRPGYSLEAPFYLSHEVFQADVQRIFGQHWIFVAVEPQIPEAGDYLTVDVGKNSIIILRDDDNEVQAFHNVCRHRGSRLCASHRGSVGNLVCPYHQWTYDTKGSLIHVEHMGADFDKRQHGLKKVHVRSLEGLIFICLADEPPADFEQMAAQLTPYMAPHRLKDCKVAAQAEIIEKGNWKLVMENWEVYHHVWVHDGVFDKMSDEVDLDSGEPYTDMIAEGNTMMLRANDRRPPLPQPVEGGRRTGLHHPGI